MFIAFLSAVSVLSTTDLSIIFIQIPFLAFHCLFFGPLAVHFISFFALSLAVSGSVKAAQFFFHV